jgi:hypothetical protein
MLQTVIEVLQWQLLDFVLGALRWQPGLVLKGVREFSGLFSGEYGALSVVAKRSVVRQSDLGGRSVGETSIYCG